MIQMHDLNPVRSWSRSGSRLRPRLGNGVAGKGGGWEMEYAGGFAESWKVFIAVFVFFNVENAICTIILILLLV